MTTGRLLALPLVAALALAALARAEEPAPAPDGTQPDLGEGLSLLQEGAGIILRSLRREMEPALRDLGRDIDAAMQAMGPALSDLVAMIGDMRNYHAPEKLPNGDIILRRKTPPAPEAEPGAPGAPAPEPGEAIDL